MNRTEHLLCVLAEECSEVEHRVSKALRFGLTEIEPGQPFTNAERITHELCDLSAVVGMLEDADLIDMGDPLYIDRRANKRERVEKFLRYSEKCGTLNNPSDSRVTPK